MTGKTTGREGAPAEELHRGNFNELEFQEKRGESLVEENNSCLSQEVCFGVNREPLHRRFDSSPAIIGATLMRKANAQLHVWPSWTCHAIPPGRRNANHRCLQDVLMFSVLAEAGVATYRWRLIFFFFFLVRSKWLILGYELVMQEVLQTLFDVDQC